MPVLDIFDREKNLVDKLQLNDEVFAAPYKEKEVLIYEVIKMQMASWRSGTHSTKTRSEISGGNSKPWRQKGTGRARRGSTRATILRGGAVALGPKPRDYSYTIPKKKRKIAMSALLSSRVDAGNLFIVKEFAFDKIKTKEAVRVLKNKWNLEEAVIIGGDAEENFIMSVRNIPEYLYLHYSQINLYDMMAYKNIIITEEAARNLNEVLGS